MGGAQLEAFLGVVLFAVGLSALAAAYAVADGMMPVNPDALVDWLYRWQTLIGAIVAGAFAIIAAGWAYRGAMRGAETQAEATRENTRLLREQNAELRGQETRRRQARRIKTLHRADGYATQLIEWAAEQVGRGLDPVKPPLTGLLSLKSDKEDLGVGAEVAYHALVDHAANPPRSIGVDIAEHYLNELCRLAKAFMRATAQTRQSISQPDAGPQEALTS